VCRLLRESQLSHLVRDGPGEGARPRHRVPAALRPAVPLGLSVHPGVVLDPAAAEDLTKKPSYAPTERAHRYTPTAPPGAWLRRIGINLAISYLRRQKLARVLPARLYIAPDRREYDRAEARDVVTKALTV